MSPSIDVITLAVTDPEATRRFYEDGLGCPLAHESADAVSFHLGDQASTLALRAWDALATDVTASPQSSGFRGFTVSYIVESAADVDTVLGRVARVGGEITKPPRFAVWGYSAYVTDPSGHLWKIASPKRRPLIARNGSHAPADAIPAQEAPITIAVDDIPTAKRFYQEALGLEVKKDYRKFVSLDGGEGASDLAMYGRDALARDADVPAAGSGFRGFTIGHLVYSPQRVDALLHAATRAGATVVKPAAAATANGDYGGYFRDLDGCLWHVAVRS